MLFDEGKKKAPAGCAGALQGSVKAVTLSVRGFCPSLPALEAARTCAQAVGMEVSTQACPHTRSMGCFLSPSRRNAGCKELRQ